MEASVASVFEPSPLFSPSFPKINQPRVKRVYSRFNWPQPRIFINFNSRRVCVCVRAYIIGVVRAAST